MEPTTYKLLLSALLIIGWAITVNLLRGYFFDKQTPVKTRRNFISYNGKVVDFERVKRFEYAKCIQFEFSVTQMVIYMDNGEVVEWKFNNRTIANMVIKEVLERTKTKEINSI